MKPVSDECVSNLKRLNALLAPALPFKLLFSQKQQALGWLAEAGEQLETIPFLQARLGRAEDELQKLSVLQKKLNAAKQKLKKLTKLQQEQNLVDKQLPPAEQKLHSAEQELENLEQCFKQTCRELQSLQQQLAETELRQTLVAKLLSVENNNPGVASYFKLLQEDFLEFANQEDSLEEEAAALLELQEIGNELKVISAYPNFYKKRSIAIAGGFSAGKSEFISSLFQDGSIHLPIGIEPTTAIPTYTLNGSQTSVIACSNNGGTVDLLAIDPDFQRKLSHNFIRSFGFNLKNIMPFIFLSTPMDFEHLCFIDTPGYNPSAVAEGHTDEDVKTAEEFVHNADALMWLIDIEKGTIAKSDLDFLERVSQNSSKPLYIVLNKADLRPQDQIEDIMQEIADTLDDYDIRIDGISAYSSTRKNESAWQGQPLFDFLQQMDQPSNKQDTILQRLFAVDEKYQYAILKDIKANQHLRSTLSGLELDLLQEGFDDMSSALYEKIGKLKNLFASAQKQGQLDKLEAITLKMAGTINAIFGHTSLIQRKKWTLEEVSLDSRYHFLNQTEELLEELNDGGLFDLSSLQQQAHQALSYVLKFFSKKREKVELDTQPDDTDSIISPNSLFSFRIFDKK